MPEVSCIQLGQKCKRKIWQDDSFVIKVRSDMDNLWLYKSGKIVDRNWKPSATDLSAKDWLIIG